MNRLPRKVQGIFIAILFLFLILSLGCAYVPSIKVDAIYKNNDTLYIATSDGAVKTFDTQTYELKNRIMFPALEYGRGHYAPRVTKIFEDNNRVYIQANQGNHNKIYVLGNREAILEVASFESAMSLTVDGKDDNYFYINMLLGAIGKTFRGFRLDKTFSTRSEGHFDDLKDLMLIDSLEDQNHFWYACIDKSEIAFNRTADLVHLTLIARNKTSVNTKVIDLGQVGTDKLYIVDGGATLWIFSGTKLFRILKENMAFTLIELPLPLVPVSDTAKDNYSYIWAMNNKFGSNESLIFKIDTATDDIMPIPVSFDKTIRIPTFTFERRFYADENYLWLYSEILKTPGAPSGNYSPYVLRISKANLTSEPLLIKPTVGEAVSTVIYNFFAVLSSPIWGHKQ